MADDDVYEFDRIVGWKVENGESTYAIKWTGFGYEAMTYAHSLASRSEKLAF